MASHLGSEIIGSENLGSENPEVDRGCDLPGEGGAAGGKEKQISILVVVVKHILPKGGGGVCPPGLTCAVSSKPMFFATAGNRFSN